MRDTAWDPVRDFLPVTLADAGPSVLIVHPSVPVKSVKELIVLARARPGDLNYASGAPGATSQLAAELFKSMAGVKLVWVPYKDNGPGVLSVIAGQTQVMFANTPGIEELAKAGRVRILAVTTAQPSPVFPGVPTVAAAGVPGYESLTIDAVVVPARTPAAIVNRLNQEIVRALNEPNTKKTLFNSGVVVVGSSPEELGAFIKSSIAKWSRVIKEAGIRAN
jgi:tripartite-type tricarboxylate transporter receptor subunit TctC